MMSRAMAVVYAVSILLVILVILTQMQFRFDWVFAVMCFGQLSVILMVVLVLKEKYTTNKTFDDWYEDKPKSSTST